jgi:iron complex outermembrane receptor protein
MIRFAALAMLAALAPAALAQSNDAVVITATRFPEDVRRLPASVTVLDAAEIEASAARTLPELLAEQAGLTMKDFFGNNAATTSVDLRGFGITGTQNTLILVDGRRVTDIDLSGVQWAAIPVSAIERIEILRGTGAVLYGDGASAGVVNIVTRSPLKRGRRAQVSVRAASFDTLEGQLHAGFTGDALGLDATLHGFESDGYRENNRNVQKNSSVNVRWGPGESYLDLRAGTDRQALRLPGARSVQPSIGLDESATDPRGAQTPLDWSSRDGERIGATWVTRLGAAELNFGADWRDKDQRAFFDQNGFPAFRDDGLEYAALTPRMRVPLVLGGQRHHLTLGADWIRWRYDSKRSDRPQNAGQPINRVRIDRDTEAFYVQNRVELSASSLLTLGWREERVEYRGNDTFDPTAPGAAFGSQAPAAAERQREHAWELGLRHALSSAWALFARAGRSFRFVGADEIYENDEFFSAQFQILRPQTARTHEAGAERRSRAARLRATLFQTDVTDEIHLDPFTPGVGNTNLPPSRRRGLELDGAWRLTGTLQLTGGYAYTDARFRAGVLPGSGFAIGTNLDIAGKRVPLVPEHKLNLGFVWDLDPRTRLSGAMTALSEQFMDNDEPNSLGVKIPAYGVVDLKLARDFGWGRLAAAVNNLLDEQYYTYAVRSQFTADRYAVYPLPGRTLSLAAELWID